MPLDDRFYTTVQDFDGGDLAYSTSLADFQLADRVALRPGTAWHTAGERTGMVVGVPGGYVRIVLDGSGKKVRLRCTDLAVIACPTRCREVTQAIIDSKDFR